MYDEDYDDLRHFRWHNVEGRNRYEESFRPCGSMGKRMASLLGLRIQRCHRTLIHFTQLW